MERQSLPWPGLSLLTAELGLENEAGCISGIIPGASLCSLSLVDAKCGECNTRYHARSGDAIPSTRNGRAAIPTSHLHGFVFQTLQTE